MYETPHQQFMRVKIPMMNLMRDVTNGSRQMGEESRVLLLRALNFANEKLSAMEATPNADALLLVEVKGFVRAALKFLFKQSGIDAFNSEAVENRRVNIQELINGELKKSDKIQRSAAVFVKGFQ